MNRAIQILFRPFQYLIIGIVDLIYPPLCLLCEERLEVDEDQICPTCLGSFKLMGTEHTAFSVPGELYIHTAWAMFDFDKQVKSLVHHLKYSNRRKPVIKLLHTFESDVMELLPKAGYDLIIPIPLHPRKLRERGYNQVADMAEWVAPRVGGKVPEKLVTRSRYTSTQTQLNAEERQANVRGAFKVREGGYLIDKRVLIVDDVVTTGATANTLAAVLLENGAKRIDLLTLSTPQLSDA